MTAIQQQFGVSPDFALMVIKRQTGTLEKALLEGVMNSKDGGATRCDITLTTTKAIIEDNGRGLKSRKEIKDWFGVFGSPHTAEENKTFGEFRIGRGQLFTRGVNTWETNEFVITVDIEKNGLSYSLAESEARVKGCRVTVDFYTAIYEYQISSVVRSLSDMARWIDMDLFVNGTKINNKVSEHKWSFEDANAYYDLQTEGMLSVYHQGVLVMRYDLRDLGYGGQVAAKKPLTVNFARNDIQDNCPVWKEIRQAIDDYAMQNLPKGDKLDRGQKTAFLAKLADNRVPVKALKKHKLFELSTGRFMSLEQLIKSELPLTLVSKGDVHGEIASKQKLAIPISTETASQLGANTLTGVLDVLQKLAGEEKAFTAVDIDKLVTDNLETTFVPEKDLTAFERSWLRVLQKVGKVAAPYDVSERAYYIGNSLYYNAWTDGNNYIAIDRKYLKRKGTFTAKFAHELGSTMLHEYCHYNNTADSHTHGHSFYEKFHDNASLIWDFVEAAVKVFPRRPASIERRITIEN